MAEGYSKKRRVRPIPVAIALLALLTTLAFVGCSSSSPAAPTSAPAKAAEPTKPAAAAAAPTTAAAAAQPTAAAAAVKPAANAVTIKAACSDVEDSTAPALAYKTLAASAAKYSNGELVIQPFFGTLGTEQQIGEGLKNESVDMGSVGVSNITSFTEAFMQFDLPFIFSSEKAYIEYFEKDPGAKKFVDQVEKDMNVKVLTYVTHSWGHVIGSGSGIGMRALPEVKVPADIKGKKIRVGASPVYQATLKAYGSNPTPIAYAQVYSSMQQGVIDGNAGSPPISYPAVKLYEVTKTYMPLGSQMTMQPVMITKKKWDALSDSNKKALQSAIKDMEEKNRSEALNFARMSMKTMTDNGMKVYVPNDTEWAQWLSIRKPVWEQVAKDYPGKIDLTLGEQIFEKFGRKTLQGQQE